MRFPDHHRDPFDRILIAQAQCEAMPLVTGDAKFTAYGLAVSPDGRLIATTGIDNALRLWDGRTGAQVAPPLVHDGWVMAAEFSTDSSTILTAGTDKVARLWRAPRRAR